MREVIKTSLIFIFSLDVTHGNRKCYKSKICIHTNNKKCGKNSDGEVRRFIDSCDMKEYNCLKNTSYTPTDDKKCNDLPKLDDNVLESDTGKIKEFEELGEPDEYDENISLLSNKPEEHTSEPEKQEVNAYVEVKESAEISTKKSDEYLNEPNKLEKGLDSDLKTKDSSTKVVKEFDPKASHGVKKMSYKIRTSFEDYEFSRDKSDEVRNKNNEDVSKKNVKEFDPKTSHEVKKMSYKIRTSFEDYEFSRDESDEVMNKNDEDVSEKNEDMSQKSEAMIDYYRKDKSSNDEDAYNISEDMGNDREDYYFDESFFIGRS